MRKFGLTIALLVIFGLFGFGAQGYPEEEYLLATKEARQHAFFKALIGAYTMEGLKLWNGARIGPEPTPIYDINGHVLFLEFPVANEKGTLGYIWVEGSKVLGVPPVYLLLPGARRYDLSLAQKQASLLAQKNYPGWTIVRSLLVCYSFPRVGIMLTLRDQKGATVTVIMDAADHTIVPQGDAKTEGAGYSSIYGALPAEERKGRVEGYSKYTGLVQEALRKAQLSEESTISEEGFRQLSAIVIFVLGTRRTVPLTLHGQETDDYCAVATGQMILEFWGYSFTQAQIAPAMGYHPGGCSQDGQVAGYESLTTNALDATADGTADWSEAVAEINAGRPLKSGIPHHARACAGYHQYSLFGLFTIQNLYIYDPWGQTIPGLPHEGAIYWERWDSITHTNWIYVRRR